MDVSMYVCVHKFPKPFESIVYWSRIISITNYESIYSIIDYEPNVYKKAIYLYVCIYIHIYVCAYIDLYEKLSAEWRIYVCSVYTDKSALDYRHQKIDFSFSLFAIWRHLCSQQQHWCGYLPPSHLPLRLSSKSAGIYLNSQDFIRVAMFHNASVVTRRPLVPSYEDNAIGPTSLPYKKADMMNCFS